METQVAVTGWLFWRGSWRTLESITFPQGGGMLGTGGGLQRGFFVQVKCGSEIRLDNSELDPC